MWNMEGCLTKGRRKRRAGEAEEGWREFRVDGQSLVAFLVPCFPFATFAPSREIFPRTSFRFPLLEFLL
jgi:hypothetical protein